MSCRAVVRTDREWSAKALRGILMDSSVVRLPRSSAMTALIRPVLQRNVKAVFISGRWTAQ